MLGAMISYAQAVSITLLLGAIPLVWIKVYLKRKSSSYASLPTPPGPRGLPILGSLFQMHGNQEWLTYHNWAQKYGDLVFVNVAGAKLLFLNSPKTVNDLLDKQAEIYSDRPDIPMLKLLAWDFNFGIIRYDDKWRTHSRMFYKYFHARKTPEFHPAIARSINLLLVELVQLVNRSSTDVVRNIRNTTGSFIMSVAYGHEIAPNSKSSDEYIILAKLALESFEAAVIPGTFWVDFFPSLMYIPEWIMPAWAFKKKASAWRPHVIDFKEKPYKMVRDQMAAGTAKPCLVTEMIENELDGIPENEYSEVEGVIKNCIATAYAGGSDTAVSSLSSFFMVMTLYPDIQKRARQELDAVLPQGAMPTFGDRDQLPYIEAVTREVIRWHPVSPQNAPHRAMADNVYEGYLIPEGTLLISNTWTILHDERVYPDEPLSFKPERFLDENGQIDENVFHPSKVAFGAGRRICVGRHVADAFIWLAIASVLRVFTISQAKDKQGRDMALPNVKFKDGIVSHPEPFLCNIKPRSKVYEALVNGLDYEQS